MGVSSELGQIPPDWSVVALGDVFDLQQGKALSPSARIGAAPRPFLRTANVLWGRLDLTVLDQMDFTTDEVTKLALRKGDLLVCEGGEIGRTAVWKDEIDGCLYQNHLHRLRTNTRKVVPAFVMYWLQAAFLHLGLYGGIGNKTTIPNLSGARLKQLPIPLPPIEEQGGIAHVLDRLQHAVSVQERTVATLRELKAATMAKLFREGLRGEPLKQTEVGEIPSNWHVQPLGSLLTSAQYGLSLRGERLGQYPILRMNCQQDGEVIFRGLQFVDLDGRLLDSFKLNEGDILFNRTNSFELVGRTAIFRGAVPAVFASYLVRLRTDRDSLNPDFLNYFMNLRSTQLALKAYATRGVSQSNISASKLKHLPVPVPPLSEQAEIVTTLDSLRRYLVRASRTGELQLALFTAMLHRLMTGQVRVPPGLIDEKLRVRPSGRPTPEVVNEIVRRIVAAVAPEKIILFGSAARGEMGRDSDLDLLVVKRCDNRREVARAVRACLRGVAPGRGKDVIVVTPEDVERDRDTIGYIIRPALHEGRILYAA